MKKVIIFIVIFTIVSLTSLLLFAQMSSENIESPIGKVTFLEGTGYVRHESSRKYEILNINNPIYTNDTVKSSEQSRVEIELTDGSILTVSENSEITVNQSMLEKERFTTIGMLYGTLHLFVKKLSGGIFNISTLTITAGIRGTELSISSRDDGAVLVDVEKGIVNIENQQGKKLLKTGDKFIYTLSGESKKVIGKIDYKKWRQEAIRKIKQNPEFYLKKMFEREKKIIEMLKAAHSKIVKYRDNWIKFLRKVRLLEKKGLYEQEKFLIKQQIKKTRKGLIFIIQTRRSLTAIRSIIAISYRMERNMQKSSDNLALLIKIRKEYRKISYIIDRLRDTEQTLKRVLYYLNVKYHRLNKRSEQL